jgi:cbb3-type cytochrome c oxidase subunit III
LRPQEQSTPGFGVTARSRPFTKQSCTAFALLIPRRITTICRASAAGRGDKVFAANCTPCHGADAKGNPKLGAPDLTDELWLYAGDKVTVMETIRNGRGGVMPAWAARLDPETIKELAIYVHSLGGGPLEEQEF